MLDAARPPLQAERVPALPVGQMVIGKPVEEVASLLPRLFNLCRAAQELAVRAALDAVAVTAAEPALHAEILRDHLMRLCVVWPRHFGQSAGTLPPDWRTGGAILRNTLFGPAGSMPRTLDDFDAFLVSGSAAARALRQIALLFGPGEAIADGLPPVDETTAFDPAARVENSLAARAASHPVMQALEARDGRGPLWRATGRVYDLEMLLDGNGQGLAAIAPGAVTVPATRGLYAVRATTENGRVSAFERVTPTDHLLAEGGILDRTLASLPGDRTGLAPLILDILDPCTPIRLTETADA